MKPARPKTNVIYDARWIIVENRFDGVSRYSHELAWALHRRDEFDITWLVCDERQLAKLPDGPHVLGNTPMNVFKELFTLPRLLNRHQPDLVYNPFFVMGTWGRRYPLILTIHDMIYYRFRTPPQWFAWWVRLGWRLVHVSYIPMRLHLNRADMIATVSETARQELLDARVTSRDIVSVPNAVNDDFVDLAERDHHNSNTIVYMGAFTPYKNVECLIDALPKLPEITLHLCSKIPPSRLDDLTRYAAERAVGDRVVFHNGTTDAEYQDLLSHARCAVSASRIEGFGLPVIEAQQHGVPFVAADTAIFREIGQDSVLFFDPDNPDELAEHIALLADADISRGYIARGRTNAARYTWDASASIASKLIRSSKRKNPATGT